VREAGYRHQMTNRSPKITANWVFASLHSRGGRFHSSTALLSTRYSSFIAVSSPGVSFPTSCPQFAFKMSSYKYG
jgi:hypothetical protein